MNPFEALIRERFELTPAHRERNGDAAVLIALTRETDPRLVFILKAGHLNSHAGEVAFPGGKREQQDADLLMTALRETHEEVGLPPDAVEVIGAGPSRVSRWGLEVHSFIGAIEPDAALEANPDEIEQVFTVPLSYLRDRDNLVLTEIERDGKIWRTPSFVFEDKRIWGLTALMLVELMNELFGFAPDLELWPRGRGGK